MKDLQEVKWTKSVRVSVGKHLKDWVKTRVPCVEPTLGSRRSPVVTPEPVEDRSQRSKHSPLFLFSRTPTFLRLLYFRHDSPRLGRVSTTSVYPPRPNGKTTIHTLF